jgi:hypothetical protein
MLTIENTDQAMKTFENYPILLLHLLPALLALANGLECTRMARLPCPRLSSRAPSARRNFLKNGHDAHRCSFNAENKLKEAAKMKSDAEDILK